jgi:hypothetical protein
VSDERESFIRALREWALTDEGYARALDEIERLRAAGDALAEVLMDGHPLIAAWQEARRER